MFLVPGRVTDDVDVVSEDLPEVFRDAAERVGRRHGLRSDWVNDAAKGGMPRRPADLEPVYRGARLDVYRTSYSYLLATKLHASRAVDLEDAVPLAASTSVSVTKIHALRGTWASAETQIENLPASSPAAIVTWPTL